MGVSTNGILFYGIDYGEDGLWEEKEKWNDPDEGWEDEFCIRTKVPTWTEDRENHFDLLKKEKEKWGCEMDIHCSCDYSMDYVTISSLNFSARRGYPMEIKSLAIPEDADDKIKAFCELMGLPYEQPKWYLASLWG